MTPDATYCLDTSFFINGWRKHYCREVFPAIWEHLDILIYDDSATVFSCVEVYHDLAKQNDDLYKWAKSRKSQLFREATEDTVEQVKRVMATFQNFAAKGGSLNASDPWVIAHAQATDSIVVTDEIPIANRKPTKPPKMPDVCDALNVPWMKPIDFFKAIGIRLERHRSEDS